MHRAPTPERVVGFGRAFPSGHRRPDSGEAATSARSSRPRLTGSSARRVQAKPLDGERRGEPSEDPTGQERPRYAGSPKGACWSDRLTFPSPPRHPPYRHAETAFPSMVSRAGRRPPNAARRQRDRPQIRKPERVRRESSARGDPGEACTGSRVASRPRGPPGASTIRFAASRARARARETIPATAT